MASLSVDSITSLFHTAQSFLMGKLAIIGVESEFAATAILAIAATAVAWGLFLLTLSLLFAGVSRVFGLSRPASDAVAVARSPRLGRAEPRLALRPDVQAVPARPGSLDLAPERLSSAGRSGGGSRARSEARREPEVAPPPVAEEPPLSDEVSPKGMSAVLETMGFEAPQDGAALSFRKVALDEMPRLAPLGRAGFSRPEWTGATAPASLHDAGAFEVCRFKVRVPAASATAKRGSEQTVDYKICSLPRVSVAGARRPDLLIYTTSERGMSPKGATPLGRK